jgi:hypothetical protein
MTSRVFGGVSTDRVVTGLTGHTALSSFFAWTYRTGNGGGGLGRIWEKRVAGAEVENVLYDSVNGVYTFNRLFSVAQGAWRVTAPAADSWHSVLHTYDQGASTNDPIVYIDGSSVTVTESLAPNGTANTNADAYVIGNRANDNARNWAGRISWWTKWNVILNANEALALARGVQPWRIRTESIVACCPLWGLHSPEIDFIEANGAATVTGTVQGNGPPVTLFTSKSRTVPLIEEGGGGGDPGGGFKTWWRGHNKLLGGALAA